MSIGTAPYREDPRTAPARPADDGRAPEHPPHPRTAPATVALSALTVVSAAAFARVFTTAGWVLPVMVVAVGGHALAAGLRQRRVPAAPATLVALAIVGLAGLYLVLPGDLTWGLPLSPLFHAARAHLIEAGNGMATDIVPVPASPGYSLLVAWGAGVAAVASDLLAFRLRSPLQALAPPVALFLTASAIGTARGREWSVGLEVAAIVVFLLAERLVYDRSQTTWLGGHRPSATRTVLVAGGISAVLAVITAVAVTPAVPAREGDGVLGWRGPLGAGDDSRITPSPFDDLRTRLLQNSDTVVMTVTSSEPSYWRLTSLNAFNGTVWSSDDSYQSASGDLPGVSTHPGTRQVRETFHIAALNSIWLPTGFDPEAVGGINRVSWDPVSGSLISSKATSNGENYTVTASEDLAALSPEALAETPPIGGHRLPTGVAADLDLPPNVPPRVTALAHQITAGATTEYAKAYALEQYFHQPSFIYSTNPPSDDSLNALSTFLFQTREGYCQQFAGAYAVLARAVGLPTRIAVGFETGQDLGGTYQVTDAEAHAWPEVWFPDLGWVPFEPTPGRQVPGATYTGDTTGPVVSPQSSQKTTAPTGSSTQRPVRPTLPSAGTVPTTTIAPAATAHRPSAAGTDTGIAAAIIAGLVVLWMGVMITIRRLRWRRRRQGVWRNAAAAPDGPASRRWSPDAAVAAGRVLVAWAEVAEILAGWHLRRRSTETVNEFVTRVAGELRGMVPEAANALKRLAGLVRLAEFSAGGLSAEGAAEAERLARFIIAELHRATPAGRRLEQLVDPRRALGSATVEAGAPGN